MDAPDRWGWWVFLVNKKNQTITFPAIANQATNSVVGLAATAGSGRTVSFAVSGPGSLDGSGTNLTFTGTGTVSIVASEAGDSTWIAAPSVTNTFAVTAGSGPSPFDTWLNGQGQAPGNPDFAPESDFDHDGKTTWEEYVADTDPSLSNRAFKLEGSVSLAVGEFCMTVPASSNRYYQMAYFTNLTAPAMYSNLGWGVPGMVITNNLGPESLACWGLRALLAEPPAP